MAEGESMWKLMGGLLALPVLLVLSVLMIFWGSGDYVRTVQLNWELELPASEGCLYETDSGASFSGDGERYHVLAYADDSGLEETLTEEATPVRSAEVPVTEILDLLAVPADQRPDFSDCRGFTAAHPTDERNRLYLLVNSAGTRLYVVECFFLSKSSTDFLIILASLRKCRNCLEYQAFPAFCVSEDTPHIMAYRSLIWRSKVVKP